MKQIIICIAFLLSTVLGWTQNLDSLLDGPQVIELSISTPQPRLNESFQVSINIEYLRATIFKSLVGKVKLSNDFSNTGNDQLTMNVNALRKGKNEMGPLEFVLDKTKFTTNKVVYEVIDALPNTDRGLWFRKVMTSDSTFCIIIEQRIPADSRTTNNSDNSITISTEPEFQDIVKFKDGYSITGVGGRNSHSNTNFSSVEIDGKERQFMYGYSVYYFNIVDKKTKIKITKDKFKNIPGDYKFEEIIVQ